MHWSHRAEQDPRESIAHHERRYPGRDGMQGHGYPVWEMSWNLVFNILNTVTDCVQSLFPLGRVFH